MCVILKDDLVDKAKAGGTYLGHGLTFGLLSSEFLYYCLLFKCVDEVIVTGYLTAKWSPDLKDVRCDLEPVLVANDVRFVHCTHNFFSRGLFIIINDHVLSSGIISFII